MSNQTDVKGNKKGKCISNKRKTTENLGPQLNDVADLVTVD